MPRATVDASLAGAPGVTAAGQGNIGLFAVDAKGDTYFAYTTDGQSFSAWGEFTGGVNSSVAAAWDGANLHAFAQGTDGNIYWAHAAPGERFGGSTSIGGKFQSGTPPAACSHKDGTVDVVAVGTDEKMYITSYDGGAWSTWSSASS